MPSISLRVYLTPFAEKGVVEPQKWTCDAAKEALKVVNAIWLKANIAFVMSECIEDKPVDMAKDARSQDRRVLDVLSMRYQADNLVHIFLVSPIPNLSAGGASYLDCDPEAASFVQSYGADEANGRAWAHELGHLLSLDHVEVSEMRSNLMTKGLSLGRDLTAKQINQAKGSKLVKRFGG